MKKNKNIKYKPNASDSYFLDGLTTSDVLICIAIVLVIGILNELGVFAI